MLYFMANDFAGGLFDPPAIWDRPWNAPQRSDLFGTYEEYKQSVGQKVGGSHAHISLNADGSASVDSLSSQDSSDTCTTSAEGSWSEYGEGKVELMFAAAGRKEQYAVKDAFFELEIAGRSKPYRLYMPVSDPDSGTGIWFRRE